MYQKLKPSNNGQTILLTLVFLAVSISIFFELHRLVNSAKWVSHTHEVISVARNIERLVVNLETGARGYALSGSRDFLQPYHENQPLLASEIERFKILTADNLIQQERIVAVESEVAQWKLFAEKLVSLKEQNKDVTPLVLTRAGMKRSDEIHRILTEVVSMEEDLLRQRNRESETLHSRVTSTWCFALLGLAGCIIYTLRRQSKVQAELTKSEMKYRNLFESIYDAVLVVDGTGNITMANGHVNT